MWDDIIEEGCGIHHRLSIKKERDRERAMSLFLANRVQILFSSNVLRKGDPLAQPQV